MRSFAALSLACFLAARSIGAAAQPVQITLPGAGGVVVVTPPAVESVPLPRVEAASAPVPNPRPRAMTMCDPGGCWDSDGQRVNRVGPVIVTPRGACTAQGATVQCP